MGEHVFLVCLACAFSDALLIAAGVAGFGQLITHLPWIDPVMRAAGAAFLTAFGARSLWSALRSQEGLNATDAPARRGATATLMTCLAITWLNPHVYLDTVVLLGSVSTQYPGDGIAFAGGAISGSFLFFFSLGYGARQLQPVFAKPAAWRVLEFGIALVMWAIAAQLIISR